MSFIFCGCDVQAVEVCEVCPRFDELCKIAPKAEVGTFRAPWPREQEDPKASDLMGEPA